QRTVEEYELNSTRVINAENLEGAELQALSQFRERTHRLQRELEAKRAQCETLIIEQRQRLVKARKEHMVLEKLKERQWKSWSYVAERELENAIADNYLSTWPHQDQVTPGAGSSGPELPSTAGAFARSERERRRLAAPRSRRPSQS